MRKPIEDQAVTHNCAECHHRREGCVQNLVDGRWRCQSCLEAAGQLSLVSPAPKAVPQGRRRD